MSDKKGSVAGTVNVQRRTWDKADFEEKAKNRAATEAEGVVANDGKWKTEFPDAPVGMERVPGSKRAYLSSDKQESVDLEKNLHQRVVLQATEGAPSTTSAFMSKKTGVVVQNSLAYLDHIHGKKYQRAMGMSMRVKAAGLSDVQARLARLKAEKGPSKRKTGGAAAAEPVREDLQDKMHAFNVRVSEQLAAKKRAREEPPPGEGTSHTDEPAAAQPSSSKAARTEASAAEAPTVVGVQGGEATPPAGDESAAAAAGAAPGEDDELAAMQAMMGFAGFAAGSNK